RAVRRAGRDHPAADADRAAEDLRAEAVRRAVHHPLGVGGGVPVEPRAGDEWTAGPRRRRHRRAVGLPARPDVALRPGVRHADRPRVTGVGGALMTTTQPTELPAAPPDATPDAAPEERAPWWRTTVARTVPIVLAVLGIAAIWYLLSYVVLPPPHRLLLPPPHPAPPPGVPAAAAAPGVRCGAVHPQHLRPDVRGVVAQHPRRDHRAGD